MSKSIIAMASVAKYFMGFGVVYMFWIDLGITRIAVELHVPKPHTSI
jgi:hypothetical protein